jgi:hypothetical protein
MALSPADLPEGYFDEYSEWLVPADAFADLVIGGPAPAGLERAYQSFYVAPETGGAVHVFLLEFASPEQATAGSAIGDAILRPPLPGGETIGPEHATGPTIGDASSTVTTATFDTWAAGGPRADVLAVSFQRDRPVAGVTAERFTDPPADGTPAAGGVTPVAAYRPRATGGGLAETLDGDQPLCWPGGTGRRASTPPVAGSLLPSEQLVDTPTPIFGATSPRRRPAPVRRPRRGATRLPARSSITVEDGRGAGPLGGTAVDGEPSPPIVAIAIAEFRLARHALAALRRSGRHRSTARPPSRSRAA